MMLQRKRATRVHSTDSASWYIANLVYELPNQECIDKDSRLVFVRVLLVRSSCVHAAKREFARIGKEYDGTRLDGNEDSAFGGLAFSKIAGIEVLAASSSADDAALHGLEVRTMECWVGKDQELTSFPPRAPHCNW